MKQWFLLLTVMALALAGCGASKASGGEVVSFYYLEKEYDFQQHGGVISPEKRDISDHRRDLPYLLALYLVGPAEENHRLPVPVGTKITCGEEEGKSITLELSEICRTMTDTEFSLACACISLTCFDITGAEQVTIRNGDRQMTMKPDSVLLVDDFTAYSETEETT